MQHPITRPIFRLGLAAAAALALSVLFSAAALAGSPDLAGQPGLSKARAWVSRGQAASAAAIPFAQTNQPILRRELADFVALVADGRAGVLRGVYVQNVLALRVVQQSPSAPYFVDLTPGVATQFGAASAQGVTGLLADNVASGVEFYDLRPGHEVVLVYGDGSLRRYVVANADRFQALSPTSPYSDFVNLDTGARLSATTLFGQMYSGGDKLTLQTCLAQDGIMAWGRLFVTAFPAP